MLDVNGYCFYFESFVEGSDILETWFHPDRIQKLQKILKNGNKVALIINDMNKERDDTTEFENVLDAEIENIIYLNSDEKSLGDILNSLKEKWPHGTKIHFYPNEKNIAEAKIIKGELGVSLEIIEDKFFEPTKNENESTDKEKEAYLVMPCLPVKTSNIPLEKINFSQKFFYHSHLHKQIKEIYAFYLDFDECLTKKHVGDWEPQYLAIENDYRRKNGYPEVTRRNAPTKEECSAILKPLAIETLREILKNNHCLAIITNGTSYRIRWVLENTGLLPEEMAKIEIWAAESPTVMQANFKSNIVWELSSSKWPEIKRHFFYDDRKEFCQEVWNLKPDFEKVGKDLFVNQVFANDNSFLKEILASLRENNIYNESNDNNSTLDQCNTNDNAFIF